MLILISAAAVFVIKKLPPTEKNLRRLLLVLSVATIVLEVYKQLVYSFDFVDGKFLFSYTWRVFPWQFCSTPMIAGLLAAVVKNERIHYGLCCYLATYGLFCGAIDRNYGRKYLLGLCGSEFPNRRLSRLYDHNRPVSFGDEIRKARILLGALRPALVYRGSSNRRNP